MKAKHTPAPWVIEGELDHICVVNNESKDERACDGVRQVCRVGQGDFEYLDYDEALANAKLIAAAPELLDQLKRCVKVLQGVVNDTLGDKTGRDAVCATFAISAMDAIDKATK
jgi:hypothetical protein